MQLSEDAILFAAKLTVVGALAVMPVAVACAIVFYKEPAQCIQEVHQGPMLSREYGVLTRDAETHLLKCSRETK